jgi:DNA polymerase-3 subunit epsilon
VWSCCRLWTEVPLLVIDVETTGVGHLDRIVEVGLARFEHGALVETWASLVNPGRPIPAEATAINKIRDEDAAAAPRFGLVVHHILRLAYGAYPVAYNAYFDKRFFLRELRRTRLDLRSVSPFDQDLEWIDPFAWVWRLSDQAASNSLANACLRHNVRLDSAHRASADAVAAGQLLFAMADQIGEMTLCELLRRQKVYTRAQQESVAQWKTNMGAL